MAEIFICDVSFPLFIHLIGCKPLIFKGCKWISTNKDKHMLMKQMKLLITKPTNIIIIIQQILYMVSFSWQTIWKMRNFFPLPLPQYFHVEGVLNVLCPPQWWLTLVSSPGNHALNYCSFQDTEMFQTTKALIFSQHNAANEPIFFHVQTLKNFIFLNFFELSCSIQPENP